MSTQQIVPMYDDPIVPRGISVSFTPEACLTYRHSGVVARLEKELGCSREMAESIFDDAKRFLFMCATQKGSFAPPPLVDEGWHAFILFTQDYAKFCQLYFGRFLHHQPFTDDHRPKKGRDGLMPMQRTYKVAKRLYGALSVNWRGDVGPGNLPSAGMTFDSRTAKADCGSYPPDGYCDGEPAGIKAQKCSMTNCQGSQCCNDQPKCQTDTMQASGRCEEGGCHVISVCTCGDENC